MKRLLKKLGYVWALPHTAIGALLTLTWYFPRKIQWRDGCLEVIPFKCLIGGEWVMAQTHGWIIFYRDEKALNNKKLRVHERVHVEQGMKGGIFYVLSYVGQWVFNSIKYGDTIRGYYEISFEKEAYKYASEYDRGLKPNAWGSK